MAPLPTPVRAAIGLAALTVEQARTLPDRALELPVLVVSTALQCSVRVQQRYAELALRGDELLSRLHELPEEPPSWATFDEEEPEPVSMSEVESEPVSMSDVEREPVSEPEPAPATETAPAAETAPAVPPPPSPPMQRPGGWGPPGKIRSWGVVAILTIITCGIYGIFWEYFMFNENKEYSGEIGRAHV